MKAFKLITIVVLALSISCARNQKLEFYGETVMVNYPKQVDTLKGSNITLEGAYTGSMYAYDGMLVFDSDLHPDGWLYLYDAATGKRINAIAPKGNGPNEFVNLSCFGNFEKDSGETCLWVNDLLKHTIVLLNMQGERVKEFSTSKFKSTNPYGIGGFHILNDSLLLAYVQPIRIFQEGNRFSSPEDRVFNYKLGETVRSYAAYSEYEEPPVEELAPGMYLSSYSVIKSDKTKLATMLSNLKRVDILDLESGKTKSIVTQDAPDLNYLLSADTIKDYYRAIECDDHYIYVLEHVKAPAPGRICVFDWDGNFVRILHIDEGDVWFAVDPIRKILYSKNDAEEVTAYDLNFLYP